jgi:predicted transcriptional regulator
MKFPDETEIKKLRKSLDITQSELASLSGVSQSTIAKMERGSIRGSYSAVVRIFEVLQEEMSKRREGMKAKDVASTNIVSIQASEKVKRATEVMRESGYSQLPVFNGVQHVGSISEFKILSLLRDGSKMEDLSELTVGSIMMDSFPIVSEEAAVEVVTSLLSASNAVLVSRKGSIVGIITSSDVLKLL